MTAPKIIGAFSEDGLFYITNGKTFDTRKPYEVPPEALADQDIGRTIATPTQAQIEAVKRVLNRTVILSGDCSFDWDYVACRVIAAAQVGEPETITEEMIKAGEQAIDDYYSGTKDAPFGGSVEACYRAMRAAAIRKLKENP